MNAQRHLYTLSIEIMVLSVLFTGCQPRPTAPSSPTAPYMLVPTLTTASSEPANRPQLAETTIAPLVNYQVGGMSLKYPSDWKWIRLDQKPNPDMKIIFGLHPPDERGLLTVSMEKVSDSTSLADFAEEVRKRYSTKHPDLMLLKSDESIIGGIKFYSWESSVPGTEPPSFHIKAMNAVSMQDKAFFLFTYAAEGESFDRSRAEVEQILESIQLNKVPYEDYEEASIFCPTENDKAWEAYVQAGKLTEQGQLKRAEKAFLQAIDLDDHFCDAMDNLGALLSKQGRIDEAIGWYQKSLEILPDNRLALRNMAIAYNKIGSPHLAIDTLRKLVEISPTDPEGYFGLGVLHYDYEQYEQALANMDIAETLYLQGGSPRLVKAQYLLGRIYYALHECTRAIGYLEMVYEQNEEDDYINYALGMCHLVSEPRDLELVKKYFLKAEALGMKLPEDVLDLLVKAFGEWPPR